MNLVDIVNQDHLSEKIKEFPSFRPGDTLNVHVKITEGEKSRIQTYQGICIAIKSRNDLNGHFRVRKVSSGVGVERVFPFHSPNVAAIEVINRGKSRRAKHFYLRERTGKGARVAVDYGRNP